MVIIQDENSGLGLSGIDSLQRQSNSTADIQRRRVFSALQGFYRGRERPKQNKCVDDKNLFLGEQKWTQKKPQ